MKSIFLFNTLLLEIMLTESIVNNSNLLDQFLSSPEIEDSNLCKKINVFLIDYNNKNNTNHSIEDLKNSIGWEWSQLEIALLDFVMWIRLLITDCKQWCDILVSATFNYEVTQFNRRIEEFIMQVKSAVIKNFSTNITQNYISENNKQEVEIESKEKFDFASLFWMNIDEQKKFIINFLYSNWYDQNSFTGMPLFMSKLVNKTDSGYVYVWIRRLIVEKTESPLSKRMILTLVNYFNNDLVVIWAEKIKLKRKPRKITSKVSPIKAKKIVKRAVIKNSPASMAEKNKLKKLIEYLEEEIQNRYIDRWEYSNSFNNFKLPNSIFSTTNYGEDMFLQISKNILESERIGNILSLFGEWEFNELINSYISVSWTSNTLYHNNWVTYRSDLPDINSIQDWNRYCKNIERGHII